MTDHAITETDSVPAPVRATACYAHVMNDATYDLRFVSLDDLLDWYAGSRTISLHDAAGSHLGRMSSVVRGHRYTPSWALQEGVRSEDCGHVRGVVVSGSELLSFDPLAE